ncbi:MAG: ImmA/IrrE family metallo-endopeptidase [Cyanobacteria bacterium MAG IRC4_bin_6]|nr:ImmA/IrrE family metallo-endopeptidase [Cyanobacteria bacterium MAG IRC3_bin_20]MDE0646849.1 ImmA/IrrE family metallo-endopeptidase [Cyanobacteria bacterium MAG IRC4_bin_6]
MTRAPVNPRMVSWARQRVGLERDDLVKKFKKLPQWETGEMKPTLKQLEDFARMVHVPVGYFFLDEFPKEDIPIPDFRTVAGQPVTDPSPDLLETIYACQERQSWYRDFALATQESELDFIGSARVSMRPEKIAEAMGETLGFDLSTRKTCSDTDTLLRLLTNQAENAGVLVMGSGIVASNTHRVLDTNEFRGFALADSLAPLIFINRTDSKTGQLFTLAHELVHLWLGTSALSNVNPESKSEISAQRREETWCNKVAAELLVPIANLREMTQESLAHHEELSETLSRLEKTFKVSKLVLLRRLLDASYLDQEHFETAWEKELMRLNALTQTKSSGGNFRRTTLSQVGRKFAEALIISTLEGQTLYRDAFQMLGVSGAETLNNLARELEAAG